HRLGGGIDIDDRVFRPRPGLRRIGITAPQIDNGFTILCHAIGRAEIGPVVEIALEGIADSFEAGLRKAVYFGHYSVPLGFRRYVKRVLIVRNGDNKERECPEEYDERHNS